MNNPDPNFRKFAFLMGLGAVLVAGLPTLVGLLGGFATDRYLGVQYNFDDHMVYAAWMRQAMDGQWLFDNRFTLASQPGLTFHAYFLVLGWLAKIVGIPAAMGLGRLLFTALFFFLAYRLVLRVTEDVFTRKLALSLVAIGGGLGFLMWQTFGTAVDRSMPAILSSIFMGRLPIDVWQPEAFVFPSLLTNGLFMVSLCLILWIFDAVLESRGSWRPVWKGFLGFALLMNIHSYDVLLVGLALVGFLVAESVRRSVTAAWIARVFVMALGAAGPALWFLYVLQNDPVFQARAATETFTPSFRQVIGGLALLMSLAAVGMLSPRGNAKLPKTKRIAMAACGLLVLGLFFAAGQHTQGYWISDPLVWLFAFALTLVAIAYLAVPNAAQNLVVAWALVGLTAIYFPALFQRKLAMGQSVPWALLAALGLTTVLNRFERNGRNLATVLGLLVIGATSILWLQRDLFFIKNNVSNTTLHPVYLSSDANKIIDYLNEVRTRRTVVLAMPGIPAQLESKDAFGSPLMPDLNPIVSGLTGCYTYAGHWSETPSYGEKRDRLMRFFLQVGEPDEAVQLLEETQADYLIAPVSETFQVLPLPLRDLSAFGDIVLDGTQFRLIRVRR